MTGSVGDWFGLGWKSLGGGVGPERESPTFQRSNVPTFCRSDAPLDFPPHRVYNPPANLSD
jgi:hypothetical protein